MATPLVAELRSQIRGITGALLVVGATFHYTMEIWWLGWTLPLPFLLGYAVVGLAGVVLITRYVGFHRSDGEEMEHPSSPRHVARDFAEILLQSFVAAYVLLLVLGIIDVSTSPNLIARLGLIEAVPLGFGAALANRLFAGTEEAAGEGRQFLHNVPIFAVGALFVASTIAPTREMELVAAHMGWPRHLVLMGLTIGVAYLVLYEVEFRGQRARVSDDWRRQVGSVFVLYAVGAVVSFLLLLGFGHFIDATVALAFQETTVLAFPATLGAAAAHVVI